jgi:acetylornithine/succinyldiaminopimelate/putrescine aminotransferase
VRFAPPLVIEQDQIDLALDAFGDVLADIAADRKVAFSTES